MVMRVRIGRRGRRHPGIGDRLVVRQPLPAHLGTPDPGRRRIDPVRLRLEHGAVILFRRILADIAATHIARETVEVTLERRAEAATTTRAQDISVAGVQNLVERLAIVEALLLRRAEAMKGARVAETGEASLEPPRFAFPPAHLRVEAKIGARLPPLLATEPATEAAGAAGIWTQRVAFD